LICNSAIVTNIQLTVIHEQIKAHKPTSNQNQHIELQACNKILLQKAVKSRIKIK